MVVDDDDVFTVKLLLNVTPHSGSAASFTVSHAMQLIPS